MMIPHMSIEYLFPSHPDSLSHSVKYLVVSQRAFAFLCSIKSRSSMSALQRYAKAIVRIIMPHPSALFNTTLVFHTNAQHWGYGTTHLLKSSPIILSVMTKNTPRWILMLIDLDHDALDAAVAVSSSFVFIAFFLSVAVLQVGTGFIRLHPHSRFRFPVFGRRIQKMLHSGRQWRGKDYPTMPLNQAQNVQFFPEQQTCDASIRRLIWRPPRMLFRLSHIIKSSGASLSREVLVSLNDYTYPPHQSPPELDGVGTDGLMIIAFPSAKAAPAWNQAARPVNFFRCWEAIESSISGDPENQLFSSGSYVHLSFVVSLDMVWFHQGARTMPNASFTHLIAVLSHAEHLLPYPAEWVVYVFLEEHAPAFSPSELSAADRRPPFVMVAPRLTNLSSSSQRYSRSWMRRSCPPVGFHLGLREP
ncbi:hypothetical protein CVT26_001283 [Gymnopilus dilepis]|uniref:Uncharacterized protein n=1 Tax=Gymnopilus dilepis TaxID=231916 RepID=A0A409WBG6_9AGAR|nr:hypothetical protein CVT26_001283 [Gymnopilus dilepis]